MKIQTECIPCLLKRIIFEAELSTSDKGLQKKVVQDACKMLSELYDPNECSAVLATKVHKLVYETLKDNDPYVTLKKQSNKVAQSLMPKVQTYIKTSKNPLKTSMLCAIIGNMMDFGIEGGSTDPSKLTESFEELFAEGIGHDDFPRVKQLIETAKKVLLFTDNCGEIVFDRILCQELKKCNPSMHLTLVVRGEPIISDATLEDAEELRFREVVDDIATTGCFAIGVDFTSIPHDLKIALDHSDIIICKGMANYEAFSETHYKPIVYLLRTKCHAVAHSMGIPVGISAIKLYE